MFNLNKLNVCGKNTKGIKLFDTKDDNIFKNN